MSGDDISLYDAETEDGEAGSNLAQTENFREASPEIETEAEEEASKTPSSKFGIPSRKTSREVCMYLFRMRQFEESTFSQHKLIHFHTSQVAEGHE